MLMKKFTLILMAALLSVGAYAQSLNLKAAKPAKRSLFQSLAGTPQDMLMQHGNGLRGFANSKVTPGKRRVPATAGTTPITEQPAGELQGNLQKASDYFAYSWAGLEYGNDASRIAYVVKAEGDTLYLKNPFSGYSTATWLKLVPQADGSYYAPAQPILAEDGDVYYAERLVLNAAGNTFVEDSTETPEYGIHFTFKDNVLSFKADDLTEVLGLVDVNGSWTGNCDWNIVVKAQTDKPITLPENVDALAKQYILTYNTTDTTVARVPTLVAKDGDTFYFNNPYSGDPSSWFKGELKDGKVTVDNNQYLGADSASGYYLYLLTADTIMAYDAQYNETYMDFQLRDNVVLNYDEATGKLTAEDTKNVLVVNAGNDKVYYAGDYWNPIYSIYVRSEKAPADPEFVAADFSNEATSGYNYILVYLKPEDVDGNYISPVDLSYKLYRQDGDEEPEVYTFYKDTYTKLDEDMSEIPYNFTDNYDIYDVTADARYIYLYDDFTGSKIGIQEFYKYSEEKTYSSNIVWLDVNAVTGVKAVKTGVEKNVEYYDLSGRRVVNPAATGIYIRKATLQDGSVKTIKVVKK